MRYVKARLVEYERDMAYRVYLTDSIYLYSQNKAFTKRWYEIIEPHEEVEIDADQIVKNLVKGAGITIVGYGGTDD